MASSTRGNLRDVLMRAGLYGKHGLKSSQVPATPQSSFSGILGQFLGGFGGCPLPQKGSIMDKRRQEQVIIALKEKGATQACPRCRNLEFEVIGESMITLNREPQMVPGLPGYAPPAIPIILVSCTNCGYIAQHATRLLNLKR